MNTDIFQSSAFPSGTSGEDVPDTEPLAPDNRSLEERILGGLDAEQREVASTLQGPMCVLAGAGTGKTRAITHRIAYGVHSGVYSPQRLLAVTFTARAAAEMRSRLRDLGVGNVQARTFHAAALRQLQFFWPQAVGGSPAQSAGPQGTDDRRGRPAAAPQHGPRLHPGPGLRNRVGQGLHADARPTTWKRPRAAAPRAAST